MNGRPHISIHASGIIQDDLVPGVSIQHGAPHPQIGMEEEIVFVKETENEDSLPETSLIIEKKASGMDDLEDQDLPKNKRATAKFIKNQNMQKKMIESGDDELAKYPADSYAFISLHGPTTRYFWFGVMVFAFQMIFLILALLSVFSVKWKTGKVDDNPGEKNLFAEILPTEAAPTVRCIQFFSLLSSLIFVDTSIMDIITAVHTFPTFSLVTHKDNVWRMAFSCFLRLLQGLLSLFTSLFLVFSSDDVIDIILNFTALNFISTLDDLAFEFAGSGKYG